MIGRQCIHDVCPAHTRREVWQSGPCHGLENERASPLSGPIPILDGHMYSTRGGISYAAYKLVLFELDKGLRAVYHAELKHFINFTI